MANILDAPRLTHLSSNPIKLRHLAGKTIVIKYGGAALERKDLKEPTIGDIALLHQSGAHVVLVHGGSRQLDQRMKEIGLQVKSIDGLRFTCSKTIVEAKKIFSEINAEIANLLQKAGAGAVALGAEETWVIKAQWKNLETYGYVGDVKRVDVEMLKAIMKQGKIPVVYALGKTDDGQVLNINADDVACAVASSLHADNFMLITDVEGILQNPADPSSLLLTIDDEKIEGLLKEHIVSKGMIPKVAACLEAIRDGVSVVHILSAQQPRALITEITGESHYGTRMVRRKSHKTASK